MKRLTQSLSDGSTRIEEAPTPAPRPGQVLIASHRSLVSPGTERMLLEFGRSGWIQRARQQPDKVRMVLEKVRADGLAATVEAVRSKLSQPITPGYSNVGRVLELGEGVEGLSVGDRVVSNGPHAEQVVVPRNLCARIPDSVSDDQAVFTVIGAIGLQGVRLAKPTLGECLVVTGLGLVGLLTVQVLVANGCRVLGVDPDPDRCRRARELGAERVVRIGEDDLLETARIFSRGRGVDGVLITASTQSHEPIHQAATMCRKRGRIVLVGVTGLELSREDFYKKELSFQVSCSYGPGRHDPDYEDRGRDYPPAFVRWTEQRNFEAVLDLMNSGSLTPDSLITHRFPFARSELAYALLTGEEPALGIVLEYPDALEARIDAAVSLEGSPQRESGHTVSFIGAGNHAGRFLMPAFRDAGARLQTLVSQGGGSASHFGKRFGFRAASTDVAGSLADPEVDALVVATRHDSHGELVRRALAAGKHVFCEKPLALRLDELDDVESCLQQQADRLLMVGFNRRFAPLVARMKQSLDGVDAAKSMVVTVNAGALPADHWTQDPEVGGGRVVGEAVHFIDLMRFLVGHPVRDWQLVAMDSTGPRDTVMVSLAFEDGSIGTLNYLSNGHRRVPKERVDVFAAGRVMRLDNFRKLEAWGWPGSRPGFLRRQDKGHRGCVQAFLDALSKGGPAPIPVSEIMEVSRLAIRMQQVASGKSADGSRIEPGS